MNKKQKELLKQKKCERTCQFAHSTWSAVTKHSMDAVKKKKRKAGDGKKKEAYKEI